MGGVTWADAWVGGDLGSRLARWVGRGGGGDCFPLKCGLMLKANTFRWVCGQAQSFTGACVNCKGGKHLWYHARTC